jgi:hypothetical protein
MNRRHLYPFFSSLLLLLISCWPAAWAVYAEGWAQTMCYSALTVYFLMKYAPTPKSSVPVIFAIILGRITLEFFRVFEFHETLFSLFVPFIAILSIVLAAVCFYEKRWSVVALSMAIMTIVNVIAHHEWLEYFHGQ